MNAIAEMRNLGPRSAATLSHAGISRPDQLHRIGSVQAFLRVKHSGLKPSINLLWAIEGALTDLPWQQVAREHRTSLLLALEDAEQKR